MNGAQQTWPNFWFLFDPQGDLAMAAIAHEKKCSENELLLGPLWVKKRNCKLGHVWCAQNSVRVTVKQNYHHIRITAKCHIKHTTIIIVIISDQRRLLCFSSDDVSCVLVQSGASPPQATTIGVRQAQTSWLHVSLVTAGFVVVSHGFCSLMHAVYSVLLQPRIHTGGPLLLLPLSAVASAGMQASNFALFAVSFKHVITS